ncbi:MAG: fucose isomerase, partial [Clostridia bacterium]|nr:fucose isomerase [Clostridia bacterium]
MNNAPNVKLGIVAVSRDCFPATLSQSRRQAVVAACKAAGIELYESPVIVENTNHTLQALEDVNANGVNALVVYLGNFGPEGPETMLAQKFDGPVMFVAAAEETGVNGLVENRGDAYCGMLNASYNLALRNVRAYIPENPVGTPEQLTAAIADFETIARVLIGVRKLKIISFGPRPFDFLACNAPIKNLFDLGVEIQENSELDLLEAYKKHEGDPRIAAVKAEMEAELGTHNDFPTVLDKLAQYEITLMDWYDQNREACEFAVFANKCWPAFQTMFGFVPCYVNSRLTGAGIPVSCEV